MSTFFFLLISCFLFYVVFVYIAYVIGTIKFPSIIFGSFEFQTIFCFVLHLCVATTVVKNIKLLFMLVIIFLLFWNHAIFICFTELFDFDWVIWYAKYTFIFINYENYLYILYYFDLCSVMKRHVQNFFIFYFIAFVNTLRLNVQN